MNSYQQNVPEWEEGIEAELASLRAFYGVTTNDALIFAQAKHIERLQAKLPSNDQPAVTRVRVA